LKVLVTGASGIAGERVCRDLVHDGFEVRMADIFPSQKEEILNSGSEFVRCDTRTPSDVLSAAKGVDLVVHLAAWHSAHTPPVSDPTIFSVNVDGTFNILQACRETGVKSLVFGSSLAYGFHSIYAVTKVIGEDLCRQFQETTPGSSVVVLRYNKFTPCSYLEFGARLLENGVDRKDVSSATVASVRAIVGGKVDGLFRTVVHNSNDAMPVSVADNFQNEGMRWLEDRVPGALQLIQKYSISLPSRIEERHDMREAERVLGWKPKVGFVEFLRDLQKRDRLGEPVGDLWVPSELPEDKYQNFTF
jgi:hypothetical protein